MQSFPNRCQHIKVNGTQCGCPALRRNKLCFFHRRHHDERIQLNTDRARHRAPTIELPVLEDANSIQVSLMQIMRMILAGQIDGKSAGLLLYALQTASANLRRTTFDPSINDVVLDPNKVGETQLSSHVWEDSDFRDEIEIEYDEKTMRIEALEKGRVRAKQKVELERMAEAESRPHHRRRPPQTRRGKRASQTPRRQNRQTPADSTHTLRSHTRNSRRAHRSRLGSHKRHPPRQRRHERSPKTSYSTNHGSPPRHSRRPTKQKKRRQLRVTFLFPNPNFSLTSAQHLLTR